MTESEPPQLPAAYRVVFEQPVDPEAVAALGRLANTYRAQVTPLESQEPVESAPQPEPQPSPWRSSQRASQSPIVHPEELAEISEELWQDPVYGEVTWLFLPRRPNPAGRPPALRVPRTGPATYETYPFGFDPKDAVKYRSRTAPKSNSELQAWVQRVWKQSAKKWPYQHKMEWQGVPPELILAETHLDRSRLAAFCDARGLTNCTYQGSLGKAADVLLVAAGRLNVEDVDRAARQVTEPLVEYKAFLGLIRSDLTAHYLRRFQDGITIRLIDHARKPSLPEVITVEGNVKHDRVIDAIHSDLITIGSIEQVAATYNQVPKLTNFLRKLSDLAITVNE
jgi:hypothetical protein